MLSNELITKVIEIVVEAGNLIEGTEISNIYSKGDLVNVVTDVDIKSQNFLIKNLNPLIENAIFLAEEKENEILTDEYTWIIDPIDGTTNYTYSFKHSAVSVALLKNKEVILGVCYNPYLEEVFYAIKNNGSYLNGELLKIEDKKLEESLIMCGTSPYKKELADETFRVMKVLYLKGKDIRRSGSAVNDLCYLAAGRVDGFYEGELAIWDFSAAKLIIEEAGGVLEILNGKWGDKHSVKVIAGNKKNISEIKEIVLKNK
ncbi:inositol monophosphatase family protein [Streptobacillus felis]|uniref:Inositol-1-monophosphatase n=1 Tax=Streptobacillus felis TaxID=1384509 RepID=A0A7Z0TBE3_9FUSO|nr:inositol monophosphatase family protein [Streptobacillus felis]NYV27278.1 inositol monophosphatase [Streptobacillus felis]